MWKKLIAAPVLGLLFVMFLPVLGFVLLLGEACRLTYTGALSAAGYIERWAELA